MDQPENTMAPPSEPACDPQAEQPCDPQAENEIKDEDTYVGPDGNRYPKASVAVDRAREFTQRMLQKAREERAKEQACKAGAEGNPEAPKEPHKRSVVLDRDVEVYVYATAVDVWNDKPKFGPARFNRNLYKLAEGLENLAKIHKDCFVTIWNVENEQLSEPPAEGEKRYRSRALPSVSSMIGRRVQSEGEPNDGFNSPEERDLANLYSGDHPTLPDTAYPIEVAKNVCLELLVPDQDIVLRIRALCAEASVRSNLDCATFTAVFGGRAVGFNYATDSKAIPAESLVQLFEASRGYSGMLHDTIKTANPKVVFPSDERRAEELRLIEEGRKAIRMKQTLLKTPEREIVLPASVAGSTMGADGVARPPEPTTIVSLDGPGK